MHEFTIRLCQDHGSGLCPVCGLAQHAGANGPRLFLRAHDDPLCRICGKKLAPAMAALLDLANAAERLGRRSRHLLTPPMESLLDLARAAENYSESAPCLHSRAG